MSEARFDTTWIGAGPQRYLALGLLALALGCTASQSFRPAEHATGRSAGGYLAADYDLRPPEGPEAGDVRVWAEEASSDGASDATVWQVGFELENEGSAPLVLETASLRLTSVRYLGSETRGLRPVRTEGDTEVPAGATGTFVASFRLPGVDPEDIEGFQIGWSVSSGAHHWSEQTPFIVATARWGGYGAPPYWGPYPAYYGPYYWRRPAYRYVPVPARGQPPRHH